MTLLRQVLAHMREGRWNEAHTLVQDDDSELAAWLHGILHIQEGDLEDAEYWYGKANRQFRSRGSLAEELNRVEAALGVCRTWSVESENRPRQGQFLPDLQLHSPAMEQKDGVLEERRSQNWTAAADLQPTISKSDRLLGDKERCHFQD